MHYHFIGIGGIGMSGIARLLLAGGAKVSGSDIIDNECTRNLAMSGVAIFQGHSAGHIQGADVVIYSSAVQEDNSEIQEARRRGVRVIKRAQALAELMKDKTVITVAGSHGKTTTTSLVSFMLMQAGLNPTAAIGGILRNIDTNACMGKGEFFVAEADESDGSFLYFKPTYSILTNIDREHLDYYKSFDREIEAFRDFMDNTKKEGCVFFCFDDPVLNKVAKEYKNSSVSYGLDKRADIYPENIRIEGLSSWFDCYARQKKVGNFYLALGGMHNISNALSVIALGIELGIDLTVIKKSLEFYQGAARRLEVKFRNKDYLLLDDYAHHPREIQATLSAVQHLHPSRLIAVFQPHRYTRTQLLMDDFAASFSGVDLLVITDIYPAGEKPIEGISGERLCEKIRLFPNGNPAHFVRKDEIIGHLLKIIKPQDIIITLGAGDIVKISDELAEKLNS